MYWNMDGIEAEQRKKVADGLGGATREELLAEIVRLRCALYPLAVTLGSLDDRAPRGVTATSDLFPADFGEGKDRDKLAVWDDGTGDFRFVQADSRDLHLHEFEHRDSVSVMNGTDGGTRMHDDVCVMQVHGHWIGAYANCGQVTMADVRRAVGAMAAPAAGRGSPASEEGNAD